MLNCKMVQIIFSFLVGFSMSLTTHAQEIEIQSSGQVKNAKDPVDPQDAATKAYVDQVLLDLGISFGSTGIKGLLGAGYTIESILDAGVGIQGILDAGTCPLELIAAGIPLDSLYGKTYQGGLIFYVDDQDTIPEMKGLVAAPQDQDFEGDWGCFGTDLPIPNVTSGPSGAGAEIGDGATNTVGIDTAGCSVAGDAAVICANLGLDGYEDWFFPSAKELNEMHQKIGPGAATHINNIGNFAVSFYWSSTEASSNWAWGQDFGNFLFVGSDGFQGQKRKTRQQSSPSYSGFLTPDNSYVWMTKAIFYGLNISLLLIFMVFVSTTSKTETGK